MGPFYVADLTAQGELQLMAEYHRDELVRIAGAEAFITAFEQALSTGPQEFEMQMPGESPGMNWRWRASADTAGIATLRWQGELVSISLLACGSDDAARITMEAFQRHLLAELHDTGYEPAFALMELKQRPLVATVNLFSPPAPAEQLTAALADRCFAAAYFGRHPLA